MENHNVSNSNTLLKGLCDNIPIGIENKDSAPTAPCNNQFPLETELTAPKSFVLEQVFLIKKQIHEIKECNHEVQI